MLAHSPGLQGFSRMEVDSSSNKLVLAGMVVLMADARMEPAVAKDMLQVREASGLRFLGGLGFRVHEASGPRFAGISVDGVGCMQLQGPYWVRCQDLGIRGCTHGAWGGQGLAAGT